jgi:RHS repeat-associated protein
MVEAYEYRKYQKTASWFMTPLRFPGQYHDAETDFFENWNRYYDPSAGRYLQPEPMTMKPSYLAAMMAAGSSIPTYSYALNNPLHFIDRDGNNPILALLGLTLVFGPPIWIASDDADFALSLTKKWPGERNGMGDAIWHCVWSCDMSRNVGPPMATIVGWLHEVGGLARGEHTGDYDSVEYEMDLHNNRCGRDVSNNENQTCVWACRQAYEQGALRTLR